MIAKISGTVSDKLSTSVIVDVTGIGYEVFITPRELETINANDDLTVYIAEQIKEDEHTLYGFLKLTEREMYYQLGSVSGVGPKATMAILSHHSVEEIQSGIVADNISLFSNVSGIGKKTAQRIILELKGKLVEAPDKKVKADDQAFQALLSLGYTSKDASAALVNIDTKLSTNERVKQALKGVK
jgi:Holliday junction DNA helicase RuvA